MKIGIFPAAAPVSPVAVTEALAVLKADGHSYSMPLDPALEYGTGKHLFSAASVSERLSCLQKLLEDPAVEAILCARGAYGSQELLEFFPFELCSKYQKPLIGMSDITALLWGLYQRSTCPAIHGPVLSQGFQNKDDSDSVQSRKWLTSLLLGDVRDLSQFRLTAISKTVGPVSAKLIAGNLTVFNSMVGTKFHPSFENHIVILEDKGEPLYKIHRMLLQMSAAGCFRDCKGIVLGSFSNCENAKNQAHPTLQEVFLDIFEKEDFPIYSGFPLGHDRLNCAVRYGEVITIKQDGTVALS